MATKWSETFPSGQDVAGKSDAETNQFRLTSDCMMAKGAT